MSTLLAPQKSVTPQSAQPASPRTGVGRSPALASRVGHSPALASRVARRAGLVAGIALAAGLAVPATAAAQDTGSLTPTASAVPEYLFPGPDKLIAWGGAPTGTCYGAVAAKIEGEGYPNSSSLNWGIAMPGIGECDLEVTVAWHNLDTDETGEKTLEVNEPLIWSGVRHPNDSVVPTGPGTVEYRLSTNAGAQAGPITVETPAYED